jgi:hypothetical protein
MSCTGTVDPPSSPAVSFAQTREFDVYVQGDQALVRFRGSQRTYSSSEFKESAIENLFQATGCRMVLSTIVATPIAILGELDCPNYRQDPPVQRAQTLRVSPRRGLDGPVELEDASETPEIPENT